VGDGSLTLSEPAAVATDTAGDVFVADTGNNRIIEAVAGGATSVIAGTGTAGTTGDGGLATSATLNAPAGIAVDSSGRIYIADTGNNRLRWIVSGNISPIGGTGSQGYGGDLAAALSALLNTPVGLSIDPNTGNIVFADSVNSRVRKIFPAN
jgi:hypothetical protein